MAALIVSNSLSTDTKKRIGNKNVTTRQVQLLEHALVSGL